MVIFECIGTAKHRSALVAGMVLFLTLSAMGTARGDGLRFCFNEWPPYVATEDGKATGITIDVMREAGTRSGLTMSFHELPWNRCLEMVRQGVFDGVLDAAKRPEFLQGPASFSAYTNTFWVHHDSVLQRFDADALQGRSVGLVDGYTYPEALMELLEQANARIDYALDDESNLHKLAFGRIETIVADYASTMSLAQKRKLNVRPLAPTHSSDHLYPSFNSGRAAEQKLLNDAVEQLLRDGVVDRIYRNHLGVGFSEVGAD